MATDINETSHDVTDLSGGVQRKSTKFISKANQADLSVNAQYGRIGGVEKIAGYTKFGNTITTESTTSTTTSSSSTSTSTSTSSSTSSSTSTSSTTTA